MQGISINKSLLALKNVVHKLCEGQQVFLSRNDHHTILTRLRMHMLTSLVLPAYLLHLNQPGVTDRDSQLTRLNLTLTLSLNQSGVPFRDSQLTRLLEPSLSGANTALVAVICNVLPVAANRRQ